MAMGADVGKSIEGLLRRSSRPVTTLHIEGSSVRLLAVRGGQVTQWGTEPLEPGLVQEGVVADPRAVGERIESLLAPYQQERSCGGAVRPSMRASHPRPPADGIPPAEGSSSSGDEEGVAGAAR